MYSSFAYIITEVSHPHCFHLLALPLDCKLGNTGLFIQLITHVRTLHEYISQMTNCNGLYISNFINKYMLITFSYFLYIK